MTTSLPLHVGHHATTLTSAAVVVALFVVAVVVAVVLDARAPSEQPQPPTTKETHP